jgi:hypothetical protein
LLQQCPVSVCCYICVLCQFVVTCVLCQCVVTTVYCVSVLLQQCPVSVCFYNSVLCQCVFTTVSCVSVLLHQCPVSACCYVSALCQRVVVTSFPPMQSTLTEVLIGSPTNRRATNSHIVLFCSIVKTTCGRQMLMTPVILLISHYKIDLNQRFKL